MTGDLNCPRPVVLGHEGAGLVEETGPGVRGVAPGDSVILMWRPRCGHCAFCVSGRPALCPAARIPVATGGLLDGTSRLARPDGGPLHHFLGVSCFAEYCVVAEESLIKVPARIPATIAAMVGCAVVTGAGAVLNLMGAAPGAGVLIIGAGGVGLSAVMGAALVGAYPIIVADVRAERLNFARSLGATHTIDSGAGGIGGSDGEGRAEGLAGAGAGGQADALAAAVRDIVPEGAQRGRTSA